MKNILNKYYLAFMAVILFGSVYSQTQISGSVGDSETMSGIPGVNVVIDGTNIGTVTPPAKATEAKKPAAKKAPAKKASTSKSKDA